MSASETYEPAQLIRDVGDVVRNGAADGEEGWLVWTIEWEGNGFVASWIAGEFSGAARAPTFVLLLVAMTLTGEEDQHVELDADGERVPEAE